VYSIEKTKAKNSIPLHYSECFFDNLVLLGNSKSMSDLSISKIRSSSFDQLLPFWPKEQSFSSGKISNNTLIESVKALEKEGLPSNEYLVVYSPKEYKALYFSENVFDILGYTGEELVNLKSFAFFNLASVSHIGFIYHLKKFASAFKNLNKAKGFNPQTIRNNVVGMRLKTKSGIEKTFMMINQFQVNENFEMNDANVCSFIDISHLYHSRNYWGIYEASNNTSDSLTQVYFNKGKPLDSFLNTNEKAILKLTVEGFSPEKVQDLLNMKKVNFDKNCANMLAKTGANDLSALLQLLNYCGVLK